MRNRLLRLRLAYVTWPRPRVVLADTPRPDCPDCLGEGGWYDGQPADPDDAPYEVTCDCWGSRRTLFPVPRVLARRLRAARGDGWSDVAPF